MGGGTNPRSQLIFFDKSQSQLDILAIPANYAVNELFGDTYNLEGG